jgi:hypothetical protein
MYHKTRNQYMCLIYQTINIPPTDLDHQIVTVRGNVFTDICL